MIHLDAQVIDAVMAANKAAFPASKGFLIADALKTCDALVAFLDKADAAAYRSFSDWRLEIENLAITFGKKPDE